MKRYYIIFEDKAMTMVLFYTKQTRDEWVTGHAKHVAIWPNEKERETRWQHCNTHDPGAY
jgi:hypothetical protein